MCRARRYFLLRLPHEATSSAGAITTDAPQVQTCTNPCYTGKVSPLCDCSPDKKRNVTGCLSHGGQLSGPPTPRSVLPGFELYVQNEVIQAIISRVCLLRSGMIPARGSCFHEHRGGSAASLCRTHWLDTHVYPLHLAWTFGVSTVFPAAMNSAVGAL